MAGLFDARLAPGAPRPEVLVLKGDPYSEILDAAEERDDDMIVMGIPRKRRFLESLRGTTLERVLRASTRPVLSVRQPVRGPYTRVIFATDMSETSAFALQTAQRLGLLAGAAPRGDKAGGVLRAECLIGCQGFHDGLRCVAMGADSR